MKNAQRMDVGNLRKLVKIIYQIKSQALPQSKRDDRPPALSNKNSFQMLERHSPGATIHFYYTLPFTYSNSGPYTNIKRMQEKIKTETNAPYQ